MTSGFDDDVERLMRRLLASNAAGRERLVTHIDAWMREQEEAIRQSFASVDRGQGGAAEGNRKAGASASDDLARASPGQPAGGDDEMLKEPSLSYYSKAKVKLWQDKAAQLDAGGVKDTPDALRFALGSQVMQVAMGVVISLHICFMAWQADSDMRQAVERVKDAHPIVAVFEVAFNTCYTLELALKLFVLRRKFFLTEERDWNLFDGALVAAGWFDVASQKQGGVAGDVSQLRLLRLLKMLRIFRMFQLMRAFKQLRLIVASMLGSIRSMIWAMLLILVVCFMFGIFFVQASSGFLRDASAEEYSENLEGLNEYWGSVSQSILSLFIASMGGAAWGRIAGSLKPVGMPYFYLFLVYIFFFVTVVTNTLTSLFVESALANSAKDKALVLNAELEQRDVYIGSLKTWYHHLDRTGDGKVSLEEFMEEADSEEMIGFCIEMDISLMDLKQFFMVLSSHGRRNVDLETFVLGCIKLRGQARALDVMDLYYEHKGLQMDLKKFMDHCEHGFERLDDAIRMSTVTVV